MPVTLAPVADAYVRDGSYARTNFGSAAQLQLKQAGAGWYREGVLRFDLSRVRTVSSAKLRLFDTLLEAGRPAVANADMDAATLEAIRAIAASRRLRLLTVGEAGADLRLLRHAPLADGQAIEIDLFGRR